MSQTWLPLVQMHFHRKKGPVLTCAKITETFLGSWTVNQRAVRYTLKASFRFIKQTQPRIHFQLALKFGRILSCCIFFEHDGAAVRFTITHDNSAFASNLDSLTINCITVFKVCLRKHLFVIVIPFGLKLPTHLP